MKPLFYVAIVLMFVAGFVLDPAGLAGLGYACATGGCGFRGVWLLAIPGLGLALWLVARRRRPKPAARKQGARKKVAGKAGARKPAPGAKPRPAGKRRSGARAGSVR